MVEVEFSIITVNYRSLDLVDKLLASLAEFPPPGNYETIVVDNSSEYESTDSLLEKHPDVKLLSMKENVGFGAGNNRAAEIASGRILVLINPDSVLREETVSKPAKYLDENPEVGILGLQVYTPDGMLEQTARGFPSASTGIFGRSTFLGKIAQQTRLGSSSIAKKNLLVDPDATEPYPVEWVAGTVMVIRRDCWDAVNGFDEDFFMYWEDADICYRALKAGFKTVYFPDARIYHIGGATTLKDPAPAIRMFHKSAYIYITKHISTGTSLLRGFAWCALNLRAWILSTQAAKKSRRQASG